MRSLATIFMVFLLSAHSAYASFNPNVLKSKTDNLSTKSTVLQNQNVIDINHASSEELMSLKGVGKKRADSIIAYRQQHGLFKSVNELSLVKGFSEKKLTTLLKNNEGRIVVKAVA